MKTLSRRIFLKSSGATLIGALAFSSGAIALMAPSKSWALALNNLTSRDGKMLLSVARLMFPHADLEDAVYAFVVKSLDGKATDKTVRTQLQKGLDSLNKAAGGDWLAQAEAQRLKTLSAMVGTDFFEAIRSDAIVSLYDNALAYAHFGYGGAIGNGGYLTRGFNDLAWLPDPPTPDGGYLPAQASNL